MIRDIYMYINLVFYFFLIKKLKNKKIQKTLFIKNNVPTLVHIYNFNTVRFNYYNYKKYNIFWKNYKFNIFFFKYNKIKIKIKMSFYYLYILNLNIYLSYMFNLKIKQHFIDSFSFIFKTTAIKYINKLCYENWVPYHLKYKKKFLCILLNSFFLKNTHILCNYMKYLIDNTTLKRQMSLFKFFIRLLKTIIWANRKLFNIKGLFFQYRGKLGRGGNTRKSKLTLKRGVQTLTNKKLAIVFNKWQCWSNTGSIGCTLYLFY